MWQVYTRPTSASDFFGIYWVCALQTGFYRLKNFVYGGQTRSKKSQLFLKNDTILNHSAILEPFRQKTLRMHDFEIGLKLCLSKTMFSYFCSLRKHILPKWKNIFLKWKNIFPNGRIFFQNGRIFF
jgi:hypothetical protein